MHKTLSLILVFTLLMFNAGLAQESTHSHSDSHDSHETHDMQDTHGADSDEHAHDTHEHEHTHTTTANSVTVGDMQLMLDPMLSVNGDMALGLRIMHNHESMPADYSVTVTTPTGESLSSNGNASSIIIQLGTFQTGTYQISGSVANTAFQSSISLYQASTDLGTDIVTVLAPSPRLSTSGISQAFIYGFADGENVHKPYSVSYAMPGMTHSSDDVMFDASHYHFDVYEDIGFEPAANQTPIGLPMVGEWTMQVTLGGSIPEVAEFSVSMTNE